MVERSDLVPTLAHAEWIYKNTIERLYCVNQVESWPARTEALVILELHQSEGREKFASLGH